MKDLIRKIEIHLETTEECIENTSLPQYVVELLEADNKLLEEVIIKWQQEQIGKSEFLQRLRATISDAEARRLILETFKNK